MGDTGDIRTNGEYMEVVHDGVHSFQAIYTPRGYGPYTCKKYGPPCNWAGVIWLSKKNNSSGENNWGTIPEAGYNLSQYNMLVFDAKSNASAGIEFGMGGVGYDEGTKIQEELYPDSTKAIRQTRQPNNSWDTYCIDVIDENPNDGYGDLSYVVGAFLVAVKKDDHPEGFTLYLDNIRYEYNAIGCDFYND